MGIIYLASFPNGKCYVGQHNTDNIKARIVSHYSKFRSFRKRKLFLSLERKFHPDKTIPMKMAGCCTAFYSACLKYGFHSLSWIVLHTGIKTELNQLEDKEILQRNTLAPGGYNLKINGKIDSYSYSEETRKRQSDIQLSLMKNNYVKYRKHFETLSDLPRHTSYMYNNKAGHHYMVINHPKCIKKHSRVKKYTRIN